MDQKQMKNICNDKISSLNVASPSDNKKVAETLKQQDQPPQSPTDTAEDTLNKDKQQH